MQVPNANVRSRSYYIAHTTVQCRACGQWSGAIALALPPSHEILIDDEWQIAGVNAFLSYVTELPRDVSRLLRSSHFCRTDGGDLPDPYWANHCEHCEALLSDDELHCEPGGFMPGDAQEAEDIDLIAIKQPFRAVAAGYAVDPEFFAHIGKR